MKIAKKVWVATALLFMGITLAFGTGVNSGLPVPYIGDNEESAVFLAESILKSVAKDLSLGKKDKNEFINLNTNAYLEYGRSLAHTLSQLTPEEQTVMWYGS